jgi:large subunit ribosomal protein L1
MDKTLIKKAISQLREQNSRKFTQSVDMIVNLKNFNVKQQSVNTVIILPHTKGREVKVAAFAGQELVDEAKAHCGLVITQSQFEEYDVKAMKKLAQEYDYFIAQASIMAKVAQAFGKVLGSRGKMPDPKMGCVVPPNASLGPLVEKLKNTIVFKSKKSLNLMSIIGNESMSDEDIVENVETAYKMLVKALPSEEQNIKNVQLKLTMGSPITL